MAQKNHFSSNLHDEINPALLPNLTKEIPLHAREMLRKLMDLVKISVEDFENATQEYCKYNQDEEEPQSPLTHEEQDRCFTAVEIFHNRKHYEFFKSKLFEEKFEAPTNPIEISIYLITAIRFYFNATKATCISLDLNIPEILRMDRRIQDVIDIVQRQNASFPTVIKDMKREGNKARSDKLERDLKNEALEKVLQNLPRNTKLTSRFNKLTISSIADAIRPMVSKELRGISVTQRTVIRYLNDFCHMTADMIEGMENNQDLFFDHFSKKNTDKV